ncbi:MAG: restriction endonuclease subunit S [Anaerolineae bacterium CFX3]|nr:restriction endonuclease subunit S [Anaerolineae bacterium CFX3]
MVNRVALGEIVEIFKGNKAPEVFDKPREDARRYLQIEDLRPDAMPKYAIDKDGTLATKNDVLIAWDGANAGTAGFDLEGYIGSTLAILRPTKGNVYAPYFGYFLRSKFNDIQKNTTGATIPHVSRDYLENLQIPLPPLSEQKRIASLLARADRLRGLRRAAREQCDSLLQSVFLEMFGEPQFNEKKWEKVEVAEITESLDSRRVPVEASIRQTKKGIYPYYGASGIIDYVDEYLFDEETLLIGEDGANLLARSTPIAFIANGKYWVNNHAHVLRMKNVNIQFLRYLLNITDLEPYVTGSAQPKLNASNMEKIRVINPPLSKQEEFARVVARVEALRARMDESARQGEALFQSLLAESFG